MAKVHPLRKRSRRLCSIVMPSQRPKYARATSSYGSGRAEVQNPRGRRRGQYRPAGSLPVPLSRHVPQHRYEPSNGEAGPQPDKGQRPQHGDGTAVAAPAHFRPRIRAK
jgi:hypothetical protein